MLCVCAVLKRMDGNGLIEMGNFKFVLQNNDFRVIYLLFSLKARYHNRQTTASLIRISKKHYKCILTDIILYGLTDTKPPFSLITIALPSLKHKRTLSPLFIRLK